MDIKREGGPERALYSIELKGCTLHNAFELIVRSESTDFADLLRWSLATFGLLVDLQVDDYKIVAVRDGEETEIVLP